MHAALALVLSILVALVSADPPDEGDGFPDPDRVPATVPGVGDMQAGGPSQRSIRLVDPTTGAGLFTTNTNPEVVGVDPLTGEDAPTGTDVGFGAPLRRYIQSGVMNGDFRLPPPDPDLAISAGNPLPYWSVVEVSGTASDVTLTWEDAGNGRGRVRFAVAGSDTFEVALEQLIPVTGSDSRLWATLPAGTWQMLDDATDVYAKVASQPLQHDLTTTGTAFDESVVFTGGITTNIYAHLRSDNSTIPADGSYIRARWSVTRTAGSAGGDVLLTEAWARTHHSRVYLVDESDPATYGPTAIRQAGGLVYATQGSTTRLLTGQLVAIPFALLNIPAGATTELQIADNALGIGTPRLPPPWGGSIVGMSYRLSTAVGAGTLRLDAVSSSGGTWTAFGAAALAGNGRATQAPGTTTFNDASQIRVEAVSNGSLTAGLDIAVLLWVLIDYDGT